LFVLEVSVPERGFIHALAKAALQPDRRKEQNVVRKGLGFNWGAAGVSTALFTGVYLADILEAAKPIFVDGKRPAHVVFEGADQLPNGPYGTSHLLSWARNKTRGMLIAWAMNGQPLTPDHGYPLRLVSPGNIGGRMVKWLTKIQVSHEESQHYLHFWDNKLLPTQVMPEEARAERKWWYDPRYIINELNTNSAMAQPDHNEVVDVDAVPEYTLKGYAYSGGGRRINRVEISIDDGTTWQLAEICYPEDLYRAVTYEDEVYGKLDLTDRDTCFCWCFWSFPIATKALKDSPAVMVRAMDEGLSGQPRDMYWNATSMMNNWWFRTAIHVEDGNKLRFEHPTMAGTTNGGWMERLKAEGQNVLQPVFGDVSDKASQQVPAAPKPAEVSMKKEGIKRLITMEELKAHSGSEEPWFVVAGEVYDGTGFLKDHPGGGDSITLVAGEDATEDFMAIHSPQGKAQLAQFHIGTLDLKEILHENKEEVTIDPIFLSKTKWKKATLESIQVVSHDSRVYRFALQAPDQHLGLPTGQHVFCRLRRKVPQDQHGKTEVVEGELVQRAYTPVSPADAKGYIDLLIKLYLPNDKYSMGGKMTR
jgi:nitrate reductase (NAD(P)H)